jgi:hypothetical protein
MVDVRFCDKVDGLLRTSNEAIIGIEISPEKQQKATMSVRERHLEVGKDEYERNCAKPTRIQWPAIAARRWADCCNITVAAAPIWSDAL